VLTAKIQEHGAGRDIPLVPPKCEVKAAVASHFATLLGYQEQLFPLCKVMSAAHISCFGALLARMVRGEIGPNRHFESLARTGQLLYFGLYRKTVL
jgi:hypothetical protein